MPVVDLPLGTTEDRLLGTIDLERAIKSGERQSISRPVCWPVTGGFCTSMRSISWTTIWWTCSWTPRPWG